MRVLVVSCLTLLVASGCSTRSKKLGGGSFTDTLIYDVLAQDRDPDYYYTLVKNNHDTRRERGAYLSTQDPFLVDKVVDAIQKLGDVQYSRLEGQAQVVVLLGEVMADDPSAMAQTHAANTLTKLALKMPPYDAPATGTEERGDTFLALVREMDGLHDENGAPRDATSVQRTTQIVTTIGDADIKRAKLARDALRPFATRDFLIDAKDPELRRAIDTALVKRMRRSIELSLQEALEAPSDHVRRESVLGIKLLGDESAMEAVLARMEVEHDWQVRAEAVEYLGKMGTAEGVAALLPILDDEDPTLRHKSRQALTRIAGRDYGRRRATWARWASARYPQLAESLIDDGEEREDDDERAREDDQPERDDRPPGPPAPVEGPGGSNDEPLPPLETPVPPAPGRGPPIADRQPPLPTLDDPGAMGPGSPVPPPGGSPVSERGAPIPPRASSGVVSAPSASSPSAIPPRSYGAPPGLIPVAPFTPHPPGGTPLPRAPNSPALPMGPRATTPVPAPVTPLPPRAIPNPATSTPSAAPSSLPPLLPPQPRSDGAPSATVLPPPLPPLDPPGN